MSSACRRNGRSSADRWGGWALLPRKNSPSKPPFDAPRDKVRPMAAPSQPNREIVRPATPPSQSNREKARPATPPSQSNREIVRPATPPSQSNREKARPASPKTPKTSHFCRAGRTFSRFLIRFTPQGELFRADPTANDQPTHPGPVRPARHARPGAHTLAAGKQPLVIHRSPPPLEVIHKLTQ